MNFVLKIVTVAALSYLTALGLPACYAAGGPKLKPVSDCIDVFLQLDPTKPTIGVIDGVSSGKEYEVQARKEVPGIQVLHISSSDELPPDLSGYDPSNYEANYIYSSEKKSELLDILRPFRQGNLKLVSGTETSPELRAELAEDLGLTGASHDLSSARVDKELMIAAVEKQIQRSEIEGFSFRTLPSHAFPSFEAASRFIEQENIAFPLVFKPTRSAGSFGTSVVHDNDMEQVKEIFTLVGKLSPLGNKIHRLLMQPLVDMELYEEWVINYLVDPEFGVVVTDNQIYVKEGVKYISTKIVDVIGSHPLKIPFQKTAELVARALGKQDALGHLEVFVRKDWREGKPVEIIFGEDGERPAGGQIPKMVRMSGRLDVTRAHILSMYNREKLKELLLQHETRPELIAMQIEIFSPKNKTEGQILRIPSLEDIQQYVPSIKDTDFAFEVGQDIKSFNNGSIVSGFGHVVVICREFESEDIIQQIRDYEKNVLFNYMTSR